MKHASTYINYKQETLSMKYILKALSSTSDPFNTTDHITEGSNVTQVPPSLDSGSYVPPLLREEPWAVPLLAASTANTVAILAFEVLHLLYQTYIQYHATYMNK